MFELIGISKIDKPTYFDRIWTGCDSYEEKEAPILGFYQVTIKEKDNLLNFEAEIRNTSSNTPQIIFSEELLEFLSSREDDGLFGELPDLADLVFEFHCNLPINLPINVK